MPIKRNFDLLTKIKITDQALMREVGLLARQLIVERTRKGRSATGGYFKGYSPKYKARKQKELGGGPVNLTVSGSMLNDIAVLKVTDNSVVIGFTR